MTKQLRGQAAKVPRRLSRSSRKGGFGGLQKRGRAKMRNVFIRGKKGVSLTEKRDAKEKKKRRGRHEKMSLVTITLDIADGSRKYKSTIVTKDGRKGEKTGAEKEKKGTGGQKRKSNLLVELWALIVNKNTGEKNKKEETRRRRSCAPPMPVGSSRMRRGELL